jgi:hypothetical protein
MRILRQLLLQHGIVTISIRIFFRGFDFFFKEAITQFLSFGFYSLKRVDRMEGRQAQQSRSIRITIKLSNSKMTLQEKK